MRFSLVNKNNFARLTTITCRFPSGDHAHHCDRYSYFLTLFAAFSANKGTFVAPVWCPCLTLWIAHCIKLTADRYQFFVGVIGLISTRCRLIISLRDVDAAFSVRSSFIGEIGFRYRRVLVAPRGASREL